MVNIVKMVFITKFCASVTYVYKLFIHEGFAWPFFQVAMQKAQNLDSHESETRTKAILTQSGLCI